MEKILYTEMRPNEFEEALAKAPIAYLPLGTLEWHGLHLPLGSDGLQSQGLFCEMAKRIGGIVLPMLFVGPDVSKEIDGVLYYGMDFYFRHPADKNPVRQMPGSAYRVTNELFEALLDGIMYQLARAGFKVVVGHGHGPSNKAFRDIAPKMKEKYGLDLFTALNEDAKYGYQSDHAAANETSIMMHFHPELVDMSELSDDPAVPPEAVNGEDPRYHASPEMGRAAMEEAIDFLLPRIKASLEAK